MRENIGHHMHRRAVRVRILDPFRHLLHGEIVGLRPQPERIPADIDGIRSIIDRDPKHFQ